MIFLRTLPVLALLLASCSVAPVLDLTPRKVLAPASKATRVAARGNAVVKPQSLVEGPLLKAPSGFLFFCSRNPGDCEGGSSQDVAWDAPMQQQVRVVNASVNRSIRPQGDAFEEWSVGVEAGDCEDYVLTKRRQLIGAGLPSSSLRIAVATTAKGEMHAVLVVKTSSGDFVLDNRNDRVLQPRETDLDWIMIASAEDPLIWHKVERETVSL